MVAKMPMLRTLMGLAATGTAMLIKLAMATNYTVGGSTGGWDTSTNLQAWASAQAFSVGDNLIFLYAPSHDVVEASKADYDSCQASSPLQMYTGGSTIVPLASPGKRYFICGTSGHCAQGMKVEVDTLAASALPPAPPPTPSPAETPSTPPPASPATPLPVSPPASSPPLETATPTKSPISAPRMSPPSPSKTPVSGPTSSPSLPPTKSLANSRPTVTSPPTHSTATKLKLMVGSTMRFGFVMMILLTLLSI